MSIARPVNATKDAPVRWGVVFDNVVFLHPDAGLCVCGTALHESDEHEWSCARGHRFELAVGPIAGRSWTWDSVLGLCPTIWEKA